MWTGTPHRGAERAPLRLGAEAGAAALRARMGRARLVDPGAAMVAIDADRREVHDAAQTLHGGDRPRETREDGIVRARRDGDEERLCGGKARRQRRVGPRTVENESLDAVGGERFGLLRLAYRAARLHIFPPAEEMQRRVAEAEAEDLHAPLPASRTRSSARP